MWKRIKNFLYNLDRAIASLFGAQPQETISSEAGRAAKKDNEAAELLCGVLNKIDPEHCAHAVEQADKLDTADSEIKNA